MDDRPHLPPNTSHLYFDRRLALAREAGRELRFVVTPRERVGYELAVKYVDSRGEPQRRWLMVDRDRDKLEQIRLALQAQEPESGRPVTREPDA